MKKYNEPEFRVVKVNVQDVITASQDPLPGGDSQWETGGQGGSTAPIINI